MHRINGRHISFGMPTIPLKRERRLVVAELIETLRTINLDNEQPWTPLALALTPMPLASAKLHAKVLSHQSP
jgi:hypothetical protein